MRHRPVTPRDHTAGQELILGAPRTVRRIRSIKVDVQHVDVAQDDVLVEIVVEKHRSVRTTTEPAVGVARGGGDAGVRGRRDAGDPRVIAAGGQKFVLVGVEDVVGGRHAADLDVGGAAGRVYVDVAVGVQDREQAQRDRVGAGQEPSYTGGDRFVVAESDARDGIAQCFDRVVGRAAPDLPRVGHSVRRVDGCHVGRVHAPDCERRRRRGISRPGGEEVVVIHTDHACRVDGHDVVGPVEGWAHGEAAGGPAPGALHVAAVPYHLVSDLARAAFVPAQAVGLEFVGVADVADVLDCPFGTIVGFELGRRW